MGQSGLLAESEHERSFREELLPMTLQSLAQLNKHIKLLHTKVDLVQPLNNIIDIIGQVLCLRDPNPTLNFFLLFLFAFDQLFLSFFSLLFLHGLLVILKSAFL